MLGSHPFFTKGDARGPIRRKRGRPSAIEKFAMMFRKETGRESAKRLRKEFGFNEKIAHALHKDIVDDQSIARDVISANMMGNEDHAEKITLSS